MNNSNQKGIALISTMIIIALISASVALMWQRFGKDLEHTAYTLSQTQAVNHLYSVESWAKSILLKDDIKLDSLDDDWAQEIPPIPVPGGLLSGRLIDLHSKLNINNLIDLKSDPYSPQYRSFFSNCLNSLNTSLEQDYMSDLVFSHVSNHPPKPMLFEHKVGLKTIETIPLKDYQTINPFITALPDLTTININTAGANVLSCLNTNISSDVADQIITYRNNKPFTTINDFWNYAKTLLPNLTIEQIKLDFPKEFINTTSQYFLLEMEITLNNNKLIARSILHRKDGKMSIMNRSYYQAQ
jgi:general secretion pathway protein K